MIFLMILITMKMIFLRFRKNKKKNHKIIKNKKMNKKKWPTILMTIF